MKRLKINSNSAENTQAIALSIGKNLVGNEVIELVGDLGSGKTTFVKGLVQGIGSSDQVTSPTFTISRVYSGPKLIVHHFDFYRLEEPGIMAHEIAEHLDEPNVVVVIEWGRIVDELLPSKRVKLELGVVGEDKRSLVFNYPEKLAYLFKDHVDN